MRYGLPYQGSKNHIAIKIIAQSEWNVFILTELITVQADRQCFSENSVLRF